jgi:hypothetical protein
LELDPGKLDACVSYIDTYEIECTCPVCDGDFILNPSYQWVFSYYFTDDDYLKKEVYPFQLRARYMAQHGERRRIASMADLPPAYGEISAKYGLPAPKNKEQSLADKYGLPSFGKKLNRGTKKQKGA